jgi:hypothetical protein
MFCCKPTPVKYSKYEDTYEEAAVRETGDVVSCRPWQRRAQGLGGANRGGAEGRLVCMCQGCCAASEQQGRPYVCVWCGGAAVSLHSAQEHSLFDQGGQLAVSASCARQAPWRAGLSTLCFRRRRPAPHNHRSSRATMRAGRARRRAPGRRVAAGQEAAVGVCCGGGARPA